MTVAELIAALQGMPQDLDVVLGFYGDENIEADSADLVDEMRLPRTTLSRESKRVRFVRIGPERPSTKEKDRRHPEG